MTESVSLRRRRALQLLSGLPMLPLAASLAGIAPDATARPMTGAVRYRFGSMAAPSLADPARMAETCVSSTLTKRVGDHAETYALAYETLFLTGDAVPGVDGRTVIAGGCFDIDNAPIIDPTAPDQRQFFSDCPDGMSLIALPHARSQRPGFRRIFAVVQFEYTSRNAAGAPVYGKLPSPIAVLALDQDERSGRLTLASYSNVDTRAVHGLWTTCGASRSPWNTHLSSEEYEPDAVTIARNARFKAFSQHFYGNPDTANPYHYGHLPEVSVHADGTGSIRKHYCLGRISHELVQVMPDERTVLMGDDATNGGLFLFVADRPRDLSAGTLYVAKWLQKSAADGGSADLRWIRLGHATSDEVEALADRLTAADIVDVKASDPSDPAYTKIPFSGKTQWVKFVAGQEKAAAFLETHRYAAYKGGSLGFTKMEGTTVNARDKIAYSAISYVQSAMKNGSGGIAIEGPAAGMVYAWKLDSGQSDDAGAPIRSEWVPVSGRPLLLGEDLAVPDTLGNLSNPDRIANPDNLKFSEAMRTLFIGEDSSRHVNNFLWAYNVDSGELSRILSCPAGAESTGLHAVDDVNGFSYIMSNFQHPGDWESPLHDKVRGTLEPLEAANYNGKFSAAVGYLTLAGRVEAG
ncbi:PhoX family protein [Thiobacillus sedimenti]|uniref:Alkaline phosphatase PhoX n=1 Tax=Thiobacillus sedimenti TaxID=3110231 RepID=A0ABZ1CKS4_9PROT|nr:alkaline phosphatase PhoX [Thiobacillus sp. SCUT-2]WRS39992.1 alkaline phosphatase PhoX [Thiobacillus sp. SCUT-2]